MTFSNTLGCDKAWLEFTQMHNFSWKSEYQIVEDVFIITVLDVKNNRGFRWNIDAREVNALPSYWDMIIKMLIDKVTNELLLTKGDSVNDKK